MQTDNYLRYQRPDSDSETEHGLQKFTNQVLI
ncbi:Hypothetical protein Tpal_861 [Trichococcus palustris]|uniref:Uncharacterized protein n=1 Tax=Trichococcus palustris TaxID=140314 RepID=A0A143YES5_9LACT|nr:Hypothetical protein Tpal_861 [Trichococcus palustris]